MFEIKSERLVLRDWRQSDLSPWAAMNADPEVREHLGPLLTTEDALASVRGFQDDLDHGFATVGLPEILAVTTKTNLRSQAVMRRIGMTHDPAEDFDDPDVEEGPRCRAVLYRKRPDAVRPDAR